MASQSPAELDYIHRIEELERELEATRNANLEFAQILSDLPDGVWQFDRRFNCIFANRSVENITGLPADSFIGRKPEAFSLPPDMRDACTAGLRQVFDTGQDLTRCHDVETAEGRRSVQTRFFAHRSADRRIVNVTAIARDITEEKRSARDAEQARHELSQILESITESFLVLDWSWRFTYVNPRVLEAAAKAREELIGNRIWDVFPGLTGTDFEREFTRVMHERVPSRFQTGFEGSGRAFEVHAYPAETGISAYVVDITDYKRAERELRTAHETLEALVHASPLPIVALQPDGTITLWNPAAERVFGWKAEEVIGKPLPFIPEEKREEHLAMRARDLQGHGFTGLEITRQRKDGSPIEISVSTAAVHDARGQVTGIISVYQDITGRKRVEQQLSQHAAELARSNADLQQFAFVTSHDLQEPLRTITSYAQLLVRRYSAALEPEAIEFLDFIVEGAGRMQRLINDLLTFSRILHGNERPVSAVDTETVLAWAIMNLNTAIQETRAEITHDRLPIVSGYEQEIIQLFQNLIGNAIKYHGSKPPRVHITAEQGGRECTFCVRDNGIGIDPAHHEQVFGVFKRLHGKQVPGTGIGLALCKRIVEKHGGRIWVESQVGEGARFYFTLPVHG